jgi:hypothetical protein
MMSMEDASHEPNWKEIDRFARCCSAHDGTTPCCEVFTSWQHAGALPADHATLENALVDEHGRWVRLGARPDELTLHYLQDLYLALQGALDTSEPQ